ncbi:MAG: DUF4954 family protein [Bacteroidales bacterium]|nr:DUF4954 family protein [Bacteroidales bacterium]
MESSKFRPLTGQERETLISNGCRCTDWERIRVVNDFCASSFRNVAFSGDVILGLMNGFAAAEPGIELAEGVYNASIHNCILGNHVSIHNISGYLANYEIGDYSVITDCGRIFTEGESTFGNGYPVSVLNENGGRQVRMYDTLSAQVAYIVTLYRHRDATIAAIDAMIDRYCTTVRSRTGVIADHAVIRGCSQLRNVRIGSYAKIEDCLKLSEGTVNSCEAAPVYIGSGVIMENFIVCSGSSVTESALVRNSFIGQGCLIGRQFSAENSLFFANCEAFLGEACSVFAGPFTVTHHKSTLLIAGLYSFMNAGSGTNQSNHMYKLGPIHQGVMERGSKTASNSYLLWPARTGPFTLVLGSHYKNVDTSKLPFSYLVEQNGESIVAPGIGLKSIGTVRDAIKWPLRDTRKDSVLLDQICFQMLSPFTVSRMVEGIEILKRLRSDSDSRPDYYMYGGMRISHHALERGIELYQSAVSKFLGNALVKRLEKASFDSMDEIRQLLKPVSGSGTGYWVDMAGLLAPKSMVEALMDDIEGGAVASLEGIHERICDIWNAYDEMEWAWSSSLLVMESGCELSDISASDLIAILEKWKHSVAEIDYKLYEDAMKEFTLSAKTGFGIDGNEDEKRADFNAVRGDFESNPFVASILGHITEKSALADELKARIRKTEPGKR